MGGLGTEAVVKMLMAHMVQHSALVLIQFSANGESREAADNGSREGCTVHKEDNQD